MQKRPVTLDVPAPFLTKIGRIIVLWANIEWKLQQLTYWAAKIGPKQARLVCKEFRAREYPDLVKNLLSIKNIHFGIKKKRAEKTSLAEDLQRA